MNTPSKEEILKMDYNQLIGIVRETNRPPGGFKSILHIAQNTFITRETKVLEIGTSTGITAIELAKLTHCKITAIDINPVSIEEAKKRAVEEGVSEYINFEIQDATQLEYADNTFDLVFCGNVTSLISEREKALNEYLRVLKPNGILAAIPMYYIETPSDDLIDRVRAAIQVNIIPWDRKFWFDFFVKEGFELLYYEDYKFNRIDESEVKEFSKELLEQPHLNELSKEAKECLHKKYTDYMLIFRENLSHMGYSIIYLRKTEFIKDRELFTSTQIFSSSYN